MIDLAAIRDQFPALGRVHRGHAVAYFDGPGGTQVPASVVRAMGAYLLEHNANTHWAYPSSEETDELILGARRAFAEFFNARPEEVAFGQNMTALTFHLARGLGRAWGPGDEIVITDLDHHANRAPWEALAVERGVTLRVVPFSPGSGELCWDRLDASLTTRTRLLALGAASNALGTVTDVPRAVRLAHHRGALCFVDAVHYAPHGLIDVAEWDCDFLVCSPYKFYGPHLGVLWGRERLLNAVDVPRLDPAPQRAPERLESGTLSHEAIVGAAEAVRFLSSLDGGTPALRDGLSASLAGVHRIGEALLARLWSGLESLPAVRLYGPPPGRPRTPTLGFTLDGVPSGQAVRRLAERGLFLSHGDFYAATVIERLGLGSEGLVRAGCACYTSEAEVDRLLEGVAALV